MPLVSLTIITKNAGDALESCVTSVRDLVEEIVVVDTGSTDDTIAIAKRLGAHVHRFDWCDDFSAARNEAIRHATGKWIFVLDADERLVNPDRDRLRALCATLPHGENVGFVMQQVSLSGDGGVSIVVEQPRLFRNLPELRWVYRVHEQIAPSIHQAGGRILPTEIRIEHSGYADPSVLESKLQRNVRLVEIDCAERPLDPVPMFCKGRMLADLHRDAEAIVALELCRSLPSARIAPGSEAARQVQMTLARCYRREGRQSDALEEIRGARALWPREAEALCLEAEIFIEMGRLEDAARCLAQSETTRTETASHQLRAQSLLGEIWIALGRYELAEAQVRPLTMTRPGYAPPWFTLIDALLGQERVSELDALAVHFGSFDNAFGATAVLHAARTAFEGDAASATTIIVEGLRRESSFPLLAPLATRLKTYEKGALPIAACLLPPW